MYSKREDRNTDATGRFVTTTEYSAVVMKLFFLVGFFGWLHSVNGTLLKENLKLQDIDSFALD